jgi:hypothetical protein
MSVVVPPAMADLVPGSTVNIQSSRSDQNWPVS